jgi:hypothetical protein
MMVGFNNKEGFYLEWRFAWQNGNHNHKNAMNHAKFPGESWHWQKLLEKLWNSCQFVWGTHVPLFLSIQWSWGVWMQFCWFNRHGYQPVLLMAIATSDSHYCTERAQPSFKFVPTKRLKWCWCTPSFTLTGLVLLAGLSSQRHRCALLVLSRYILSALHKVLVVGNIGCHRRKSCLHIFSTECIVARLLSLAHCAWSSLTTWCIVLGSTFSPSGHFRQLQLFPRLVAGLRKTGTLLEMSVKVGQVQWAAGGDAGGAESWRSDPSDWLQAHPCWDWTYVAGGNVSWVNPYWARAP